jgi:hypothetical protein
MGLLIQHVGISHTQAHAFLNARGVKCSISAVRCWSRGAYAPPAEAFREIWSLAICLRDPSAVVPPEAPERFLSLRATCIEMGRWWEGSDANQPGHPDRSIVAFHAGEHAPT